VLGVPAWRGGGTSVSVKQKPLHVRHDLQSCAETNHRWCDPTITIEVEGFTDIYRLARHMEHGQVEFCAIGRSMLRALDRWHPGIVDSLKAQMGPARADDSWKQTDEGEA
jgi:hypothetical protein